MAKYRLHQLKPGEIADVDEFETILATHPAQPGTYVVVFTGDGQRHRTPVILWGVHADCSLVPITFDGVWGGVEQANQCVLMPDGMCVKFEEWWDTLEEAQEDLKTYDRVGRR